MPTYLVGLPSLSTDWKNTHIALKELRDEWKTIGSAGQENDNDLWNRFQSGQSKFYERRRAFLESRNKEYTSNLRRKEILCREVESLTNSIDWKSAKDTVRALQNDWKQIGRVPWEDANAIWSRFKSACDAVFEMAHNHYDKKREDFVTRMLGVVQRKEERVANLQTSIEYDQELILRWEDTIDNLFEGGRADEIRDSLERKISSVEDKIRSKEDVISELQSAINDIEARIR